MILLTKQLEERFAQLGDQDHDHAIVVCKFFAPTGAGTWFATSYDPRDRLFFGWVTLGMGPGCDELGYFSLDELQSYRGRFGLGIERDIYFQECPIEEVISGKVS